MQFLDEARIHVKAGNGGDGSASFLREKFRPAGGPSGGDGGRGGSVILVADPQLTTLLDFKYHNKYKATRGEDGRSKDQHGKGADDLIIKVPVGTIVTDLETGAQIHDMTTPGETLVIAKGGTGGRGNLHFKTAWNRAPRQCEPGTPGEERSIQLTLKLIADVGLLGFPNVGKSTFISAVSRAKPKIANYPFTTLVPHLGVVGLGDVVDGRSFVLADIPGLIEGAAEGIGLGHQFLRHVERTRVLIHLLELSNEPGRDPIKDFGVLNKELKKYDPELAERPQIVVLNKIDVTEVRDAYEGLKKKLARKKIKLHAVSAATREGLGPLLEEIWKVLHPVPGSEDV